MKLSNESRIDELMRFKEEFNNNLKSAYKIYEEHSKTFTNNLMKKKKVLKIYLQIKIQEIYQK